MILALAGSVDVLARPLQFLTKVEQLKESFSYMSPEGKDEGINIRVRAAALHELLSDKVRLAEERGEGRGTRSLFRRGQR